MSDYREREALRWQNQRDREARQRQQQDADRAERAREYRLEQTRQHLAREAARNRESTRPSITAIARGADSYSGGAARPRKKGGLFTTIAAALLVLGVA